MKWQQWKKNSNAYTVHITVESAEKSAKWKRKPSQSGKWITGRMTTVFYFIISNAFWYVCVQYQNDNFFSLSRRYCWSQWLVCRKMAKWNVCGALLIFWFLHMQRRIFQSNQDQNFVNTFFCVSKLIRRDMFEAKTLPNSSLMNRQPVHTENMLAVTQTQSLQFDFHEENAIETKNTHNQFAREIFSVDDEKKNAVSLTMQKRCKKKQKKQNLHWMVLGRLFVSVIRPNQFSFIHSFIRCDYTQVTWYWVNDANTWCNSENYDKRASKQQQQ